MSDQPVKYDALRYIAREKLMEELGQNEEVIDLKYIIKNIPSTKTVREFMKNQAATTNIEQERFVLSSSSSDDEK